MKRKDQRDYTIWDVQDAVAFLARELNCTAAEASRLLAGGAGDCPPPKEIFGDHKTFRPEHVRDWVKRHKGRLTSLLRQQQAGVAQAAS